MKRAHVHSLLEEIADEAPELAPQLAEAAFSRGLAVTSKDGQTKRIPVTVTPVILSEAELRRRQALSALLSSAALKMARAALEGPHRDLVLAGFSPLEQQVALRTFAAVKRLVTTRVDFFVPKRPVALEINATIPAMQGYSDIAARSFIEVVGRHAGLPEAEIDRLCERNGSNSAALYQALVAGFRVERQRPPSRIGLLCRRADPQLTEQRYLARRFTELGTEAEVIFPDELSGDDAVLAGGRRYDLIYRHLFVRRLEDLQIPYLVDLFAQVPGRKVVVLNPPASQVEVKTTFALLSLSQHEKSWAEAAGLTGDEKEAIQEAVPWTRPFRREPTSGTDGKKLKDLVAHVSAEPERYVLKRAWDYGGKAVFLGHQVGTDAFADRVRAAYGRTMDWPALCALAADDEGGGGYVVQELVRVTPQHHLLCVEGGPRPVELHVDFSAYASVGLEEQPAWGGVCRGSLSQIVNIVGGGGVLPLIVQSVAETLAHALRDRKPTRGHGRARPKGA
jgi:hypothetical protein